MSKIKATDSDSINKKKILNEGLESFQKERNLLSLLRKNATSQKIPIIDDEVGYFLSMSCLLFKPENILEIGCGTGYSTYFLIKNMPANSLYTGIDLNKDRLAIAQEFINCTFPEKDKERILFYPGNFLNIFHELKQKYNMVFIDAAKYEYPEYIKLLPGKLADNALIIADNVFYSGKVFKKHNSLHDSNSVRGIKEYIDFITENEYFQNSFLDIGDGVAVSLFKR